MKANILIILFESDEIFLIKNGYIAWIQVQPPFNIILHIIRYNEEKKIDCLIKIREICSYLNHNFKCYSVTELFETVFV